MRIARAAAIGAFFVFVACGFDWTVVPKNDGLAVVDASADSSDVRDGGAPADSAPPPISCAIDNPCRSKKHYCAYPDRYCGKRGSGTCTEIPLTTSCANAEIELACTCDDSVVKTRCLAASFGLDLSVNAICDDIAPGEFRCGFLDRPEDTFCVETVGDGLVDYSCRPFTCPERSCACSEASTACAGGTCTADGGTFVRCAGAR